LFGYDSYVSYYNDASVDGKVHDVQVPLLCLNAADDPFSPLEGNCHLTLLTVIRRAQQLLGWPTVAKKQTRI